MRQREVAASSGTASASFCAGRQQGAATSRASALAASDGVRTVLRLSGSLALAGSAAGPGDGRAARLGAFATILRT